MAAFLSKSLVLGQFHAETTKVEIGDGVYGTGKPVLWVLSKERKSYQVMSPANWRVFGNAEIVGLVDKYESGAKDRAALVECAELVKARMDEGFPIDACKAVALKKGYSAHVVERVLAAAHQTAK